MASNSTISYMETLKSMSLDHFLDKDVDLNKFFSKEELVKMTHHETRRFKNIAQNYEIMMYMRLPAIKPEFMKGPAYRAKQAKKVESLGTEEPPPHRDKDSDDSDEEWTPDMERRK